MIYPAHRVRHHTKSFLNIQLYPDWVWFTHPLNFYLQKIQWVPCQCGQYQWSAHSLPPSPGTTSSRQPWANNLELSENQVTPNTVNPDIILLSFRQSVAPSVVGSQNDRDEKNKKNKLPIIIWPEWTEQDINQEKWVGIFKNVSLPKDKSRISKYWYVRRNLQVLPLKWNLLMSIHMLAQ